MGVVKWHVKCMHRSSASHSMSRNSKNGYSSSIWAVVVCFSRNRRSISLKWDIGNVCWRSSASSVEKMNRSVTDWRAFSSLKLVDVIQPWWVEVFFPFRNLTLIFVDSSFLELENSPGLIRNTSRYTQTGRIVMRCWNSDPSTFFRQSGNFTRLRSEGIEPRSNRASMNVCADDG